MDEDDVTRDGLPRFIYGEHTGEMPLPPRPEPEEDDAQPAKMDRQTMILLGSGGLALLLIIGLIVAALSLTGGGVESPAAADQESATPSATAGPASAAADSPEPTKSWALQTDIGHQLEPSGKPTNTTRPGDPTTRPGPPKPTITIKPRPSRHG